MIKTFLRIIIMLTVAAVFQPGLPEAKAGGPDAAVVQSLKIAPYDDAVAGFAKEFSGSIRQYNLSDTPADRILASLTDHPPGLVVAVGAGALDAVLKKPGPPVLALMVLDLPRPVLPSEKIYAISMVASPALQISAIRNTMPKIRSVGLIYLSDFAKKFAQNATIHAEKNDITLVTRKVETPKGCIAALAGLQGQVDALWMVPDVALLTAENIEYMLLLSVEKKKPVITFSEKFVELGATMAIAADEAAMGRQAARYGQTLLSMTGSVAQNMVYADSARITVNMTVLRKLNIMFKKEAINNIRIVR